MRKKEPFQSLAVPVKNGFRRARRRVGVALSRIGGGGARFGACRGGATAVEFALVVPIYLVMTIGVVEMGRALWIKATMQHAVEQTTRYFMVNNSATDTTLATYASDRLGESGFDTSNFTFAATDTTIDSITYKQITITHSFTAIVEIVKFPDISMTAQARAPYN